MIQIMYPTPVDPEAPLDPWIEAWVLEPDGELEPEGHVCCAASTCQHDSYRSGVPEDQNHRGVHYEGSSISDHPNCNYLIWPHEANPAVGYGPTEVQDSIANEDYINVVVPVEDGRPRDGRSTAAPTEEGSPTSAMDVDSEADWSGDEGSAKSSSSSSSSD